MGSLEQLLNNEHKFVWAVTGPLIEDPRKLAPLQLISITYDGNTHIAMMRSTPEPTETDDGVSYRIEAMTLFTVAQGGVVTMKSEPTRTLMKSLSEYGNISSTGGEFWDPRQIKIFDDAASPREIDTLDEIDIAGAWGLYQNVASLFWEEKVGAQKLTSLDFQNSLAGFSPAILREVQIDKLQTLITSCDPKQWDDVLMGMSYIYSLCERPGKHWMTLAKNKHELHKKIDLIKQCIETTQELILKSKSQGYKSYVVSSN
jgi:hypothetical protein